MEGYWYISFSNTLINLAMMARWVRFQLTICLSLLENTTNTFIESFATWCFILKRLSHSRTKFRGSNLDCHSFSCWQGTGYFMLETEENVMQCGQWKTSCIGRTKTEDRIEACSWASGQTSCCPKSEGVGRSFCSCLTSIMNFSKRALKKSIIVELCEEDHSQNNLKHTILSWWILKPQIPITSHFWQPMSTIVYASNQ